MVPEAGLEPARHCWRGILSPLCLPIPPPGLSELMIPYFQRKNKSSFDNLSKLISLGI